MSILISLLWSCYSFAYSYYPVTFVFTVVRSWNFLTHISGTPMPGRYIPQCKDDGSFEEVQCHPSTGYCWCVDTEGWEIEGTKIRGMPSCKKSTEYVLLKFIFMYIHFGWLCLTQHWMDMLEVYSRYTVCFTNEGQIIICNKTVAKINSEM